MDDRQDGTPREPVPLSPRRGEDDRRETDEAGSESVQNEVLEETREERIERLRKLIEEGKYQPDPYEVARAMMERGGLT